MAFATAQGRVLFSHNIADFVALHTACLTAGQPHAGIVLYQQNRYGIGESGSKSLVRLVGLQLT